MKLSNRPPPGETVNDSKKMTLAELAKSGQGSSTKDKVCICACIGIVISFLRDFCIIHFNIMMCVITFHITFHRQTTTNSFLYIVIISSR